ncbi:sugar transferase [Demetria terragena]|uniref:sugar transferase n=1 Tax=Demetria terragena TaxID=63959 RepID=UPI000371C746|nr:sugar transferase [Demetria terragena]
MTRLRGALLLTDALLVALAVGIAHVIRFGWTAAEVAGLGTTYSAVSIVLVLAWVAALGLSGAYRTSILGYGQQEFRAILRAGVGLFAAFALLSYVLQLLFARGYVVIAFPLGVLLTGLGRLAWRRFIVRARRQSGAYQERVLVVGGQDHLRELIAAIEREPAAGYVVQGVCCDDLDGPIYGTEVRGREADAASVAVALGVDAVAWAGSRRGPAALRTLAWDLEPDGVDLLVMSDLTEVSRARLVSQPIAGVPLLRLGALTFRGSRWVWKTVFDYALATVFLVLSLPVQAIIALAILVSEGRPIIYRQTRVGRDGVRFTILKFRTMVADADHLRQELVEGRPDRGPLFKLTTDPRVTPVGRVLRRFSLDELPQFVNVLRGDMSLVGPRPPLPQEVAEYGPDMARRRMTVRPGLTGLWQVSGRSDLTWSDSARLDLYYVDNWSATGDLVILGQTIGAVLRGRGAY